MNWALGLQGRKPKPARLGAPVHLASSALTPCEPGESEIGLATALLLQGGSCTNTKKKEVCFSQIFIMISPHMWQEVKARSQPSCPHPPSPPRQRWDRVQALLALSLLSAIAVMTPPPPAPAFPSR